MRPEQHDPVGARTPARETAPTSAASARRQGPWLDRPWQVARQELRALHLRLLLAGLLLAPLPDYVGSRLRVWVLRLAGFNIGDGTLMAGTPKISGGKKLHGQLKVGRYCWFNIECVLDVHEEITIGNRVHLGQQVMLLTNTHELGPPGRRSAARQALAIKIENGAWLGARCTILPGVTVGKGAVVAAGAVVTKDVPPNALVAGIPARVVRELS